MLETYLKFCEAINYLDELKSIVETKKVYDYMECCALEKVQKDILSGRDVDWSAVDNVNRQKESLLEKLDALYAISKDFLKI